MKGWKVCGEREGVMEGGRERVRDRKRERYACAIFNSLSNHVDKVVFMLP